MTNAPTASAHTPGPWLIGGHGKGCKLVYSDFERDEIAGAKHYIADLIYNEANARLIAAAPDLLQACRLLIEAYDRGEENCSLIRWEDVDWAYDAALDALAKAA